MKFTENPAVMKIKIQKSIERDQKYVYENGIFNGGGEKSE